jgi:hypothetical protein
MVGQGQPPHATMASFPHGCANNEDWMKRPRKIGTNAHTVVCARVAHACPRRKTYACPALRDVLLELAAYREWKFCCVFKAISSPNICSLSGEKFVINNNRWLYKGCSWKCVNPSHEFVYLSWLQPEFAIKVEFLLIHRVTKLKEMGCWRASVANSV